MKIYFNKKYNPKVCIFCAKRPNMHFKRDTVFYNDQFRDAILFGLKKLKVSQISICTACWIKKSPGGFHRLPILGHALKIIIKEYV